MCFYHPIRGILSLLTQELIVSNLLILFCISNCVFLFQKKKKRWGLGTHGPALDKLAPTKQLASKISIKVERGVKRQIQVAKEAFLIGGDYFRALNVKVGPSSLLTRILSSGKPTKSLTS